MLLISIQRVAFIIGIDEYTYRGLVSLVSMGLAEPINFERKVLKPIMF